MSLNVNIKINTPPGVAHASYGMAALTAIGGGTHTPFPRLLPHAVSLTVWVVCSAVSVAGYAMKGSVPSLAGGLGAAAVFGASGYLITQGGTNTEVGFGVATLASGALAVGMAQRYRKTGKLMPAGLLVGVGLASALYHGAKYVQWTS